MSKYISFGNWNKKYFAIIFEVISLILYHLLTGFSFSDVYSIRIVSIGKFNGHYIIHYLFLYIIVFVISLIFYLVDKYKNKGKEDDSKKLFITKTSNSSRSNSSIIYNLTYSSNTPTISYIFVLFIIFLYVLVEQAFTIFKIYFKNCDFWMIELYIIAYLNAKMFKIKVFNHQMLVILIDIIPIILKGFILGLSFFDKKNYFDDNNLGNYKYDIENPNNKLLKLLQVAHWPLLILALIIYFIIAALRSYTLINIKKFMDLKCISLSAILMIYSLTGAIFCSLFAMFTTFFRCGEILIIPNTNKNDINDYQCRIKYDKNKYIDNYKAYFNKWIKDGTKDIENEIIFLVFGGVSFFLYKFSTFLLVRELTPLHKIFTYPIQYFIEKIILCYKLIGNAPRKFIIEQYGIDIASDVISFLGFLIYLEIIELNFCKLNYNLRKNIMTRGESICDVLSKSSSINEEEPIELTENYLIDVKNE